MTQSQHQVAAEATFAKLSATAQAKMSVPESPPSSSVGHFFNSRSFRRVTLVLGIGSAAALAWFMYRRYYGSGLPKGFSLENLAIEESNKAAEQKRDEIKVVIHQCPRGYYTPCIAPFPMKLETFMRVARIPYEVNFSNQPQEKDTPWLSIGDNHILQSHECIKALCSAFDIDLEKDKARNRKTAANLVSIMLDNHIYWGIALWRWVFDAGNSLKEIQPFSPMGEEVMDSVTDSVKCAAWYHGIGRLSYEEVTAVILKDLGDLSAALGKHPYFLGSIPGEVDCNAFAMLSQIIWNMPESPFEAALKKHTNLVDFVLRMKDNYWPDWDELLQNRVEEITDSGLYATEEITHNSTLVGQLSAISNPYSEVDPESTLTVPKITSELPHASLTHSVVNTESPVSEKIHSAKSSANKLSLHRLIAKLPQGGEKKSYTLIPDLFKQPSLTSVPTQIQSQLAPSAPSIQTEEYQYDRKPNQFLNLNERFMCPEEQHQSQALSLEQQIQQAIEQQRHFQQVRYGMHAVNEQMTLPQIHQYQPPQTTLQQQQYIADLIARANQNVMYQPNYADQAQHMNYNQALNMNMNGNAVYQSRNPPAFPQQQPNREFLSYANNNNPFLSGNNNNNNNGVQTMSNERHQQY